MSKFARSLLSWVAIAAFVVGVQFYTSRNLVSGQPPALQGVTAGGAPFDLNSLRGQPAALYFWASWCPVCKAMQGAVNSVASDHRVVGVAMQSGDAEEVRRYLKSSGLAVDSLPDEDGAISQAFGLRGVPTVFVLNSQGQIRFATSGYTSGPGLRLRLWLAGL